MKPLGMALLVVVVLGSVARLYQLHHGLPQDVYVDAFKFVEYASHAARIGEGTPQRLQHPGLFTGLLRAVFEITGAESRFSSYLLARLVSAFAGITLIWLTFYSVKQWGSARAALIASSLCAASITLVSAARVPVPDVVMSCFMLLCLHHLVRPAPGPRQALLAGLLLGLAAGTKYTGLLLAPWVVLAMLVPLPGRGEWQAAITRVALATGAAVIAFVSTTPRILFEFAAFWQRLQWEWTIQSFGQIGRVHLGHWDYLVSSTPTWEQPWLGTSLLSTEGGIVMVMGLLALVLAAGRRLGRAGIIHGSFLLAYLLLVSQPGHIKAIRFLIPVLPSLFILVGLAVDRVLERFPLRWQVPVTCLSLAVLLSYQLPQLLRFLSTLSRPATTDDARDWLRHELPPDQKALLAPWFLHTPGLEQKVVALPADAGSRQYRVPDDATMNGELAPIYTPELVDWMRDSGIRYFVSNAYFDGAFSDIPENRRWFPQSLNAHGAFLDRLAREADVVWEIGGFGEGRPGPDIRIYRLR